LVFIQLVTWLIVLTFSNCCGWHRLYTNVSETVAECASQEAIQKSCGRDGRGCRWQHGITK